MISPNEALFWTLLKDLRGVKVDVDGLRQEQSERGLESVPWAQRCDDYWRSVWVSRLLNRWKKVTCLIASKKVTLLIGWTHWKMRLLKRTIRLFRRQRRFNLRYRRLTILQDTLEPLTSIRVLNLFRWLCIRLPASELLKWKGGMPTVPRRDKENTDSYQKLLFELHNLWDRYIMIKIVQCWGVWAKCEAKRRGIAWRELSQKRVIQWWRKWAQQRRKMRWKVTLVHVESSIRSARAVFSLWLSFVRRRKSMKALNVIRVRWLQRHSLKYWRKEASTISNGLYSAKRHLEFIRKRAWNEWRREILLRSAESMTIEAKNARDIRRLVLPCLRAWSTYISVISTNRQQVMSNFHKRHVLCQWSSRLRYRALASKTLRLMDRYFWGKWFDLWVRRAQDKRLGRSLSEMGWIVYRYNTLKTASVAWRKRSGGLSSRKANWERGAIYRMRLMLLRGLKALRYHVRIIRASPNGMLSTCKLYAIWRMKKAVVYNLRQESRRRKSVRRCHRKASDVRFYLCAKKSFRTWKWRVSESSARGSLMRQTLDHFYWKNARIAIQRLKYRARSTLTQKAVVAFAWHAHYARVMEESLVIWVFGIGRVKRQKEANYRAGAHRKKQLLKRAFTIILNRRIRRREALYRLVGALKRCYEFDLLNGPFIGWRNLVLQQKYLRLVLSDHTAKSFALIRAHSFRKWLRIATKRRFARITCQVFESLKAANLRHAAWKAWRKELHCRRLIAAARLKIRRKALEKAFARLLALSIGMRMQEIAKVESTNDDYLQGRLLGLRRSEMDIQKRLAANKVRRIFRKWGQVSRYRALLRARAHIILQQSSKVLCHRIWSEWRAVLVLHISSKALACSRCLRKLSYHAQRAMYLKAAILKSERLRLLIQKKRGLNRWIAATGDVALTEEGHALARVQLAQLSFRKGLQTWKKYVRNQHFSKANHSKAVKRASNNSLHLAWTRLVTQWKRKIRLRLSLQKVSVLHKKLAASKQRDVLSALFEMKRAGDIRAEFLCRAQLSWERSKGSRGLLKWRCLMRRNKINNRVCDKARSVGERRRVKQYLYRWGEYAMITEGWKRGCDGHKLRYGKKLIRWWKEWAQERSLAIKCDLWAKRNTLTRYLRSWRDCCMQNFCRSSRAEDMGNEILQRRVWNVWRRYTSKSSEISNRRKLLVRRIRKRVCQMMWMKWKTVYSRNQLHRKPLARLCKVWSIILLRGHLNKWRVLALELSCMHMIDADLAFRKKLEALTYLRCFARSRKLKKEATERVSNKVNASILRQSFEIFVRQYQIFRYVRSCKESGRWGNRLLLESFRSWGFLTLMEKEERELVNKSTLSFARKPTVRKAIIGMLNPASRAFETWVGYLHVRQLKKDLCNKGGDHYFQQVGVPTIRFWFLWVHRTRFRRLCKRYMLRARAVRGLLKWRAVVRQRMRTKRLFWVGLLIWRKVWQTSLFQEWKKVVDEARQIQGVGILAFRSNRLVDAFRAWLGKAEYRRSCRLFGRKLEALHQGKKRHVFLRRWIKKAEESKKNSWKIVHSSLYWRRSIVYASFYTWMNHTKLTKAQRRLVKLFTRKVGQAKGFKVLLKLKRRRDTEAFGTYRGKTFRVALAWLRLYRAFLFSSDKRLIFEAAGKAWEASRNKQGIRRLMECWSEGKGSMKRRELVLRHQKSFGLKVWRKAYLLRKAELQSAKLARLRRGWQRFRIFVKSSNAAQHRIESMRGVLHRNLLRRLVKAWRDYSSQTSAFRKGVVRRRLLFEILRRREKRIAWERWMQLMYKGRDKDAAMSRIRLIAAMDKMKLWLQMRRRQNRMLPKYVRDFEYMDRRRCYRALVRLRKVVMRAFDQQWMDNRAFSHVCQRRKHKGIEAWKWFLLARWRRMRFLMKVSGCKCRKYLRRWRRWTLKARVLGRSHFDLTRILQLEVQRKVFVVLLGEFILAQNLRLFRVRREQQLKSLIFHKWARLTKWQCRSLAGASRIGSISSIRAKHDAFRQWTRFAGAHILKQGVLRFWRWRVERTLAIRLAVVRCHLRVPRLREALRTWKQVLVRRQQQRLAVGIFKRCEEKISRSRAFLSWKLMDHIQKGEGRGQKLWEDRRKKKVMETLISLMRIRGKKRKELQRAEMYYLHRSVQVSFFRLYTELGSGDFHGSSSSWRSLLEVSGWKRITRGEGEERQSG